MSSTATYIRDLDPRLKMAIAMVLGPALWALGPLLVAVCGAILLVMLLPLAASQPLGTKMVRSMFFFVLFWVLMKVTLDAVAGITPIQIAQDSGILALRLISLLMLGLCLALSTSARALGLAVSWAIRPFVGKERAWKLALSLALMIHFLPLCLSTMTQVKDSTSRRCPDCGFRQRMTIVPQAVIRNLGQKTWNQTLAVAGRGLENPDAWEPDFDWSKHDTAWASLVALCAAWLILG
ncbi:MAG: energy-coupling factor transporter transmembrane protein EcfT [Pseudodesulfovibrio sp.]